MKSIITAVGRDGREHRVIVADDGSVSFVYNDALAQLLELGDAHVERASHVEPVEGGGWCADMSPSGGPKLATTTLRSEALEAELLWLRENRGL